MAKSCAIPISRAGIVSLHVKRGIVKRVSRNSMVSGYWVKGAKIPADILLTRFLILLFKSFIFNLFVKFFSLLMHYADPIGLICGAKVGAVALSRRNAPRK